MKRLGRLPSARAASHGKPEETGRIVYEEVVSRVLRQNPLGDAHVRSLPVYLPPGYDTETRRYPVIFMLAGFGGSGRTMLNFNPFSESLEQRIDRLVSNGHMKPCIVVLPDALTSYGGSQYVNSRATGRYADYLARELVRHVDSRFRTLPSARHRAVMGKSSGGYGALVHGMLFPDVFGAVASHSGDMCFEYCYLPDFPKAVTEIGHLGSLEAWWGGFRSAKKKTSAQMLVLNTLAMAAAYSPTRSGDPDLPFDLETGAMRARVWEKWLAKDPLRMLPRYARALGGMRLVFLDAGTRDEWNLHLGARMFAARARELGIKIAHDEFDDGHRDVSYRYDVSLPLVARAIS
jgi:S-formylglutathione hydrolase FrmB